MTVSSSGSFITYVTVPYQVARMTNDPLLEVRLLRRARWGGAQAGGGRGLGGAGGGPRGWRHSLGYDLIPARRGARRTTGPYSGRHWIRCRYAVSGVDAD